MSTRTAKRSAWTIWTVAAAATGLGMLLLAMVGAWNLVAFSLLTSLTLPTIGAIIISRRPENRVGWLFALAGMVGAVGWLGEAYAEYSGPGSPLPARQWMGWLAEIGAFPVFLTIFTFGLLLFPDGKLPSRRWRTVAWPAVGLVLLLVLHSVLITETVLDERFANPTRTAFLADIVDPILDPLATVLTVVGLTIVVASFASTMLRFRRARGVERQQLKWLAYVAAVMVPSFVLSGVMHAVDPEGNGGIVGTIFWLVFLLSGGFGLPAAITVAILRYRLYDIDRIINRTLVYGVLTISLVLVYLGLVLGLGSLIRSITGESSSLVVAVSTLAAATLFRPLKAYIQSGVDRRFYRHDYDAARTLETFSARLRDEIDLEALTIELHTVVQETMRPSSVSLWLRSTTSERIS